MSITKSNFGGSRIAAIYSSSDKVAQAKLIVMRKLGIPYRKIKVIKANNIQSRHKSKGKRKHLGKKMLGLHLVYGASGFSLGMIIAYLLVEFGPDISSQNHLFTLIALISPALFVGLLIAGLLSLRAQGERMNQDVVEHTVNNNWTLVIDTTETEHSKEDIVSEIACTDAITIHQ